MRKSSTHSRQAAGCENLLPFFRTVTVLGKCYEISMCGKLQICLQLFCEPRLNHLTFAIVNSNIKDSKNGGANMSSIDLVILGIVLEKPQSAYDIQKDVDYHHLSRWTKISVPSIYRKVVQLNEKGYLQSDIVKGDRFADKAVYSITEKGRSYFEQLMDTYVSEPVPLLFDFNVVITNLNKMNKEKALELVAKLRNNIAVSAKLNDEYATNYADIPLVGRTVFEQQRLLYRSLLEWLDEFESQYKGS